MAPSNPSASKAVLDFDPQEADPTAVVQTRRLLSQVLAARGAAGLRKALYVSAPTAAALKHRVACVTCRSRLDPLVASLETSNTSSSSSSSGKVSEDTLSVMPEGPLPLTSWLAADSSRGLEPAPLACQDLASLAAFLASFGAGGMEDVAEDLQGRRGAGRSSGIVRCQYHAQYCAGCGFRCNCGPKKRVPVTGKRGASSATTCYPMIADAAMPASAQSGVLTPHEKDRFIAILQGGTTDAEWKQLGTVDLDTLCDLLLWLTDRGLCDSCIDAVVGLQQEIRCSAATMCGCGKCPSADKNKKAKTTPSLPPPPNKPRIPGMAPEVVRVQGRLRAICGIYRIQQNTLNGRAVYKKDRSEAYLLYTTLKDWMFSGRPDAGGTRCEGWAYVTDPAEFPDEVCGVWKVSGARGWEEDTTLVVSCYEGMPAEFREKRDPVSLEGSSAMTQKLCYEDGILRIPIQKQEVLEEILRLPEKPPPPRNKSGGCSHIFTLDGVQQELQAWLRHLIRDRLEAQRKRILAQGQVGAALCKMFACAALQQLEEAAEPAALRGKDKKGRTKKVRGDETVEVEPPPAPAQLSRGQASSSSRECEETPAAASASPQTPACGDGSDASASTRASSEEPPDEEKAQLAAGAKRLMEEMGWTPQAPGIQQGLAGEEVAEWREQNPSYRQAVQEARERLRVQFKKWAELTQ